MKEVYYFHTVTYHNGVEVGSSLCSVVYKEPEKIENEKIYPITWENLNEMNQKLPLNLGIFNFKHGRVVSFDECSLFRKNYRDVWEKKGTPLNVEVKTVYTKANPTFDQLTKMLTYEELENYKKEHTK